MRVCGHCGNNRSSVSHAKVRAARIAAALGIARQVPPTHASFHVGTRSDVADPAVLASLGKSMSKPPTDRGKSAHHNPRNLKARLARGEPGDENNRKKEKGKHACGLFKRHRANDNTVCNRRNQRDRSPNAVCRLCRKEPNTLYALSH